MAHTREIEISVRDAKEARELTHDLGYEHLIEWTSTNTIVYKYNYEYDEDTVIEELHEVFTVRGIEHDVVNVDCEDDYVSEEYVEQYMKNFEAIAELKKELRYVHND